ncbi:hypothetical protein SUGI_0489930 [Cryptomeria japonica]|nr:hypothetical protein SUGI_0489930 [Cryptomeria japonica]
MESAIQSVPWYLILCSTFLAIILFVLLAKSLSLGKRKNLPPGNLGLPLIGQTFEFLSAYRSNTPQDWIEQKVLKYGSVFKTSLMGCPTVVLNGPAGNRLLFQNDFNIIANKQPISLTRIVGKKSILELSGEDHKRMRSAIMQFLKPEALQKFLAGDLLFGLNDSEEIEILSQDFTEAFKALWSLPLDLPGTAFRSELKARSRICKRLSSLLKVRRRELHEGKFCPGQDLMSNMLSSRNENGKAMTEEEIIDNMIALMSAGHETTCNLLINVLRLLALNPHVYQKVLEEHMEILTKKEIDEPLTWDDIQKMKYTWKVCQETMRLISPVFGGFRKAMKDVEFGGFVIPKGWQLFWVATSTHMNDEIFKEPNNFDPSHFDSSIPPYNFVAFGGGPRICPSYDFAKMETLIYLHHLVGKYKWSLVDQDEKIIRDPMPFPINELLIKIQKKDK